MLTKITLQNILNVYFSLGNVGVAQQGWCLILNSRLVVKVEQLFSTIIIGLPVGLDKRNWHVNFFKNKTCEELVRSPF